VPTDYPDLLPVAVAREVVQSASSRKKVPAGTSRFRSPTTPSRYRNAVARNASEPSRNWPTTWSSLLMP
jgi:hypothetical protein